MASAPIAGGGNEDRIKQHSESKVYRRKTFRGVKNGNTVTATLSTTTTTTTTDNDTCLKNGNTITASFSNVEGFNNSSGQAVPHSEALEDANLSQQQPLPNAASDDLTRLNGQAAVGQTAEATQELPADNGVIQTGSCVQNQVNCASKPKQEMQEIRRKFESELEIVRNLVKRIEAIQKQFNIEHTCSHISTIEMADNDRGAYHVHSEVGSVGVPMDDTRPLRQLSISVIENGKGTRDLMEREKRTPKANQFYRNSEFLLAKDRIPLAESNKKSKLNGKKHSSKKFKHGFCMATKIFNACVSLLEKLMKHKHGWVFNTPVDAEELGLHDYCSIIRHPMDLGTVKTRLNKNWYKSPQEFAEDVRLTFHNAMTYNPEGQDVHVMAEQLLKIFEDRWIVIESNYYQETRSGMEFRATLPSSNSMRHLSSPVPPLDMRKILRRSESLINPTDSTTQPMSVTPSARTPSLKKPQAKDPFKRDMTYNEKKRLSTNLQNLPSEKLDSILQIIKKRNFELLQQDDEIEVDIDNVDTETLWELDRLVSNYRKSMSKSKRKAELAMLKARAEAEHNDQTPAPDCSKDFRENRTDENVLSSSSPFRGGQQKDHSSKSSSSSSSSSSDSGSSSSDSDSDSSSASGSDAGSPSH